MPIGQSETLLQLFRDEYCVFRGEHERYAAPGLLFDRFDGNRGGVSGHRAGIAEAEIHIAMAVLIVEMSALCLPDNRRERTRPLHHPVHRDAREQRFLAAFENRFGLRVFVHEALLFALHEGL